MQQMLLLLPLPHVPAMDVGTTCYNRLPIIFTCSFFLSCFSFSVTHAIQQHCDKNALYTFIEVLVGDSILSGRCKERLERKRCETISITMNRVYRDSMCVCVLFILCFIQVYDLESYLCINQTIGQNKKQHLL